MSEKVVNKLHDVYLLLLGDDKNSSVYHCCNCGKVTNGDGGARQLDLEVCTGKRGVQ